ncbi:MAG: hypothetical protein M0Q88_07045 [Bacilli bacterium]|nr:hypothetical protein [Bacilli bacterium]
MKKLILFLLFSINIIYSQTIKSTILNIDSSHIFNNDVDVTMGTKAIYDSLENKIYFMGRKYASTSSAGESFTGWINLDSNTKIIIPGMNNYNIDQDYWGLSVYSGNDYSGHSTYFKKINNKIISMGAGEWQSGVSVNEPPRISFFNLSDSSGGSLKSAADLYSIIYNNQYYDDNGERVLIFSSSSTTHLVYFDYLNEKIYGYFMPAPISYSEASYYSRVVVGNFSLGDDEFIITSTRYQPGATNPALTLVPTYPMRLFKISNITKSVPDTIINNNFDFTNWVPRNSAAHIVSEDSFYVDASNTSWISKGLGQPKYTTYDIRIKSNNAQAYANFRSSATSTFIYGTISSSIDDIDISVFESGGGGYLSLNIGSMATQRGVKVDSLVVIGQHLNVPTATEIYQWNAGLYHKSPLIEVDREKGIAYFMLVGGTNNNNSILYKFDGTTLTEITKPSWADTLQIKNFFFIQYPSGYDYSHMMINLQDTVKSENYLVEYSVDSGEWSEDVYNIKYSNGVDTLAYLPQNIFRSKEGKDYYYKTPERQKWIPFLRTNNVDQRVFWIPSPTIQIIEPGSINKYSINDTIRVIFRTTYPTNIILLDGIPIDTVSVDTLLNGQVANLQDTTYFLLGNFVEASGEFITSTDLTIKSITGEGESSPRIIFILPTYFLNITNVNYVSETEINITIESFGILNYYIYVADTLGGWVDENQRWLGDKSKWTQINTIDIADINIITDTTFTWNSQIPYEFKYFHGNFSRLIAYVEVPPFDTTIIGWENFLPDIYKKETWQTYAQNTVKVHGLAPYAVCSNWGWFGAGISTNFWIDVTCGWVASARTFKYGSGNTGGLDITEQTFESYGEWLEFRDEWMKGTTDLPKGTTSEGGYNGWYYTLNSYYVYVQDLKGIVNKGKPFELISINYDDPWVKPIISPVGGFWKFYGEDNETHAVYRIYIVEKAPGLGGNAISFSLLPWIPYSDVVIKGIYDSYTIDKQDVIDKGGDTTNDITRDYFRGIKPRANRHQKYPYNLKGR